MPCRRRHAFADAFADTYADIAIIAATRHDIAAADMLLPR